jgi:parvulin-like peptidyl-prolyl isomerase
VLDYRRTVGLDLALQEAKQLYQQIQKGETLTKAAKTQKLTIGETGLYKANEPLIPSVGGVPEFTETALALTGPGKSSLPFRSTGSVFVIELISKESVPDSVYASAKDSLYLEALHAKQSEIYNLWYSQLRTRAEIKDYREEFFRQEETPPQG